jgi:hypothetical protein
MPFELKPITIENLHIVVPQFIDDNRIIIGSYEDMMDVYLSMLRAKYFFTIDKDLLKASMEDLTYMYCPGDDMNKERALSWVLSDDEDDDSDDEIIEGGSIEEIPAP